MVKAQIMGFRGYEEVGRDQSKVEPLLENLRFFLSGGELAAKCTREAESHANEGWFIDKDVVSKT